ncbi:MAG: hypothetical protein M1423_00340 [Acidobacteria bacterium]|nr:hypothetical protein [Acidobacteriota bacterium]
MDADTVSAIFNAGLVAVDNYRECYGPDFREDGVSERSLSAMMALQLHESGFNAPPEALYTQIVDHLHMPIDEAARTRIRQLRADIALYKDGQPKAVIELKIISDGDRLAEFARDLFKGDPVFLSERLPVYAVALICETKNRTLDQQKAWVDVSVGQPLSYSRTMLTSTGEGWKWCFGCARRGPSN